MIPLRTKFNTQTTVISHRRRKRFSSSAGLLSQSEFSDRRYNVGFCNNRREKLRGGGRPVMNNFDFRNVILRIYLRLGEVQIATNEIHEMMALLSSASKYE